MAFIFLIFLTKPPISAQSLEEVEEETAPLAEEETLKPPPRRIDDITQILNQAGKFNVETTASFKRIADAAPPSTESKEELADFYKKRGSAAYELGRYKQTLEDFKMALRLAGEAGINDPSFLHRLAVTELDAGNYKRAIELFEQNVKTYNYIWSYMFLSSVYAGLGDIEGANKIKREALRHCRDEQDTPAKKQRKGRGRMEVGPDQIQIEKWGKNLCIILKAHIEGRILEAQGKFKAAERQIRRALQKRVGVGGDTFTPETVFRYKAWLARNLYFQGRFLDSEMVARNLLKESLGHGGQESAQTFSAISTIANNLAVQGRTQEAEKLLTAAIKILETSGVTNDSRMAGQVRSYYGNLLAALGDFPGALIQFDQIKTAMQENQYLYQKVYTKNPSFLLSLVMAGRPREALEIIAPNYERYKTVFGEKNFNTAEMLALRGMAYSRLNNPRQALEDFSGAAEELSQFALERGGFFRNQRVKTIIHDYLGLLEQTRGTRLEKDLGIDAVGLSFKLSEVTRSQTVQSALLASSARAAETDPEVIDLIRREQDNLKEKNAVEASLLEIISAPFDQQDSQLIKELRLKVGTLRQSRNALLEEIKKRSGKYANFVNLQVPFPSAVQKILRPHEALLSIYTFEDRTYIWAIPPTGRIIFSSVPIRKKDLAQIINNLRASLDPNPVTVNDIPPFDLNRSYELYRHLFLPVREGWKAAQDLLIIVNDPVSHLPLSILITALHKPSKSEKLLFKEYQKAPWIIHQASITMVPSALSFLSLRQLPPGSTERKAFIGFGDPIFNRAQMTMAEKESGTIQVRGVRLSNRGGLDSQKVTSNQLENLNRLPDTAEEIKTIAATLKADLTRDIFLGKDASETKVKTMDLSDRQIVAFATHALVPGDLDGLEQPALALSSPTVTGLKEDGLLTMGEIMKLKLNADWVILSACNTGAAEGLGAEALSGLGKAFFYAGTRALLASMYPVETTSARQLTTHLFRSQMEHKKLTRAQALRKAMLDLIQSPGYSDPRTKRIVFSYAHPLFWAPFVLSGDGGGENTR
jgi:CHAT domain-containing protein/tetratricopeptide (TPR) repeat protein